MMAGPDELNGLHLVSVKLIDPALRQAGRQDRRDRDVAENGVFARVTSKMNEFPVPIGIVRPGFEESARVHPATIEAN
jgi:hypothetical protein